jgi:translation initiation factor 4A
METETDTDKDTTNITEEVKNNIENWDELNIKSELLRGIYAYGFENPSEIQKKAILPIIQGKDIIAQAQSGSGKTGTFSIGILQSIDISINNIQAVIIVPTHELAKQVIDVISNIGSFMEGIRIMSIIGGSSIQEDALELRNNTPHIIVGCTGRIYDMIMRKYLNLSKVKLFVLDEADEMLSKGFKDQIYNIFQHFPSTIQTAIFSATLPTDIISLTDKFMNNPIKIFVKKEELSLACIKQYFIALNDDNSKFETLKNLFSVISISQCIIYCNSVKRVVDLHQAMMKDGFSVCSIHSSMDRSQRNQAFQSFKNGNYRVLISSDITSRGIDIQQVEYVINFDVCKCIHNYLHRIGRSGRYGRKGIAINFITVKDVFYMKKIEQHYGINIDELPGDFTNV